MPEALTEKAREVPTWHVDYRDRPVAFMRDVLDCKHPRTGNVTLWEFQRYLAEAVFRHRFVSVASSRGTGKSFAAGRIALAYLYTRPSRVIICAPSMRQVEKVVLSEAKTAWHGAQRRLFCVGGKPSSLEIKLSEQCWLLGIPAKDPDNVRGFHAAPQIPGDPDDDFLSDEDLEAIEKAGEDESIDLLLVIDEPQGVHRDVFRVFRGMFNKPNVRCLKLGNPMLGLDDDHDYVRAFRDGSGWHRIRVSAFPKEMFPEKVVTYERTFDRVPDYLVSAEDKARALRDFDEEDPIFLSDWLGRFSPGTTAALVVPRSALEAALATECANTRRLGPRIGVDIGTGNPDPCVASLFVDGLKRAQHVWRPEREDREAQVTIAMTIQALATKWGVELGESDPECWDGEPITGGRISIDDSGMVGVGDILGSRGIYVDRVNFATKAEGQWRELVGTQRFLNIRAEMHWVARRGLQEGIFVIPQEFRESWEQATWTHFERTFDGVGPVIKCEAKEKVIQRKGRSPDVFDADILAMRHPPEQMFGQRGRHTLTPVAPGAQPIRAGRLRPTKLHGGRKL